ncbi:MAG: ABC transporter permease [Clostridia bacterium]|nr:ABC transporter permease [Clostridia bacterium]
MEEIKLTGHPFDDGLTDDDFAPVPDRSAIVDSIRPSMRYWPEVGRRLMKNKVAVFSILLLTVIVLMAILVPILSPYEYDATSLMSARKPPSWEHPFGTDKVGRDMFTRVFMGTRTSLIIGVVGAFLPFVLGMVIGAVSGWFGGKVDMIIMRVVDIMLCIPSMIYMILILVVLGGSPTSLIIALALSGWMGSARSFRGRILQFRNREFVLAATTLGARPGRIIVRHILPNILGNMAVGLCSAIPGAIFAEAGMSYIGLGISPPMTSLGQLSSDGMQVFLTQFYLFFFPSLIICLIVFALFLFGNALRDALDPKLRDEDYLARMYRKTRRLTIRNTKKEAAANE